MNTRFVTAFALCSLSVLAFAGCSRKAPDTNTQIDQAAQAMVKADSSQPAAAAAPATATPTPTPSQQMNEAVASYKSGDLNDAVDRFLSMRTHTPMSGAELMALNNAMSAVMVDIYKRAANGDVRAQEAIKEYNRMQNSR